MATKKKPFLSSQRLNDSNCASDNGEENPVREPASAPPSRSPAWAVSPSSFSSSASNHTERKGLSSKDSPRESSGSEADSGTDSKKDGNLDSCRKPPSEVIGGEDRDSQERCLKDSGNCDRESSGSGSDNLSSSSSSSSSNGSNVDVRQDKAFLSGKQEGRTHNAQNGGVLKNPKGSGKDWRRHESLHAHPSETYIPERPSPELPPEIWLRIFKCVAIIYRSIFSPQQIFFHLPLSSQIVALNIYHNIDKYSTM